MIGIIGTHKVGLKLAEAFAKAGEEVRITNSRGEDGARAVLDGAGLNPSVGPASMAVAMGCEIVVLAFPWTKVRDVLDPAYDWGQRIVVDTTNIYLSYPPHYRRDDLKGDSGSEIVARLAPTARVVKAFNTLPIDMMFAPMPRGMKRVVFMAGDDALAVATVGDLITRVGFHPVALGPLATAGRLLELEAPLSLLDASVPFG